MKRGSFVAGLSLLPFLRLFRSRPARSRPSRSAWRGAAEYETWRRRLIWQEIKPQRYPCEIVRIAAVADIARAVGRARNLGCRISIVSGGHSYIGAGIQDRTILLDLSGLKQAAIAADGKTGVIQPGLRVGEFEAVLRHAGLAFPFGHDPHVGLGGYLLGGGLGWNPDSWGGAACRNIEAVEVVLATGEQVRADRYNHPDLLWAARGAGPNFPAIVSAFHVALYSRPPVIRESLHVYPLHRIREVAAWLERVTARKSRKLEISLTLFRQPDSANSLCSVSIICFAGSEQELEALHQEVRRSAPPANPVADTGMQQRTFADLLAEDRAAIPARHDVETIWTDSPYAAACAAAREFAAAPSPDSIIYFGYRNVQDRRVDGAYSVSGRSYIFADAAWRDRSADALNRAWLEDLMTALEPFRTGSYINETDWIGKPDRLRSSYTPASLARLSSIIETYDPEGVFSLPLRADIK